MNLLNKNKKDKILGNESDKEKICIADMIALMIAASQIVIPILFVFISVFALCIYLFLKMTH